MFPFSLRNSFLSAVAKSSPVWLSILVPVVLSCSHRGSVVQHRPVISAWGAESRIMVTIRASSPLFRCGKSASVFFIGGIMANYGRIVKLLLTVKRENGKLRAGWEKTTHNIPLVRITSCKDVCWWFISLWPFQYLTRESLRFMERAIMASIVLECAIFCFSAIQLALVVDGFFHFLFSLLYTRLWTNTQFILY